MAHALKAQTNGTQTPKSILTVSLSKHLTGHPIKDVIATNWDKVGDRAKAFNNVGFDVDGNDFDHALQDLSGTLQEQDWDGVVVGWCLRGYQERTVMFERVVTECVEAAKSNPQMKIMFCTGPDDIAATTLRNFA